MGMTVGDALQLVLTLFACGVGVGLVAAIVT